MSRDKSPFFVGYLSVPGELRAFVWTLAVGLTILGVAMGYWIGTTQDDPGPGAFRFDFGPQTVTGVIELTPLPILHVTEGSERIGAGHALMLSGQGKNGAQTRSAAVNGQRVTASGILLQRGKIDMLQLRGGTNGLQTAEGSGEIPPTENLGRWRLAGEICDGKCLAGAMRPGRGLAHKACANLCVAGGVPPVFVSSQPVEGQDFMMISGPGQTEIPAALYDFMAQFITVEGNISRHGDLLVFAMDPETIKVLP
ncbi:MAG: hypothetical protein AAF922_06905 [Pseudomonadota bacterium]